MARPRFFTSSVPWADFAKRLLFVSSNVSQVEIFWVLLIPDLILMALIGNVIVRTLARRSIRLSATFLAFSRQSYSAGPLSLL